MSTARNKNIDTPIAEHIWQSKYRLEINGVPQEAGIEDSWRRVADSLAAVEPCDQSKWAEAFYHILENFRFLPGGRILAGAGTSRRVTLFNCFVMGVIDDRMESIFEHLKQGALTMQAGGGTGYDFSNLRSRNSVAHASGRIASGPVSFMRIWDAMCATILSTGARRGAMIASLRCDHPDIEDFIDAKRTAAELQHFNLSVQVSDAFMQAVERNASWPLVFPADSLDAQSTGELVMRHWTGRQQQVACRVVKLISARQLWQRIMRAAYDTAEPGVLFVDRINALNNLYYRERITTTNPCGEIPLPPYGACDLGSINLTQFVLEPFTEKARMDLDAIAATVKIAVRLLDNVIDASQFPLPEQAKQALGSRRTGLGLTGLADALIMLGLHYAGQAARQQAQQIMQRLCHTAYRTSIELAQEKGSFPHFDRDAYLQGRFIRSLPQDIRNDIAGHGIRNSHLLAIAPTGTISLLAGNVSSGIEPVFDFSHQRRVLNRAGEYEKFAVSDYAYRHWPGDREKPLPDWFVDARSLPPEAHLGMQAVLQPLVDNAISKTINVPENYAFEDFSQLYESAYRLGLKGCTSYRATALRGEILLPGDQPGEEGMHSSHCCSIEREAD